MKTAVGFSARDSAGSRDHILLLAERTERERERERERGGGREAEAERSNESECGSAVTKRISVLLRAENTGD